MKRIIAMVLVFTMVFGTFSGCSSGKKQDKNTESEVTEKVETTEQTELVEETEVTEVIDATETVVPEPTAQYTYTEMSVIMYAQKSVNVRSLPCTDGEKVGNLSVNQEVQVTGQCNETGWYKIDYNGQVAFVSNNYLGNEKVEVQQQVQTPTPEPTPAPSDTPSTTDEPCPYPLYTIMYDSLGLPYFYGAWGGSENMDPEHYAKTEEVDRQIYQFLIESGDTGMWSQSWKLIGTYQGLKVVVRYFKHYDGELLADPESRGIATAGNGIFE